MNTQYKKSTQIFSGILSGIGIWLIGFLMSGRLVYVENMVFYDAGALIVAFPFIFALVCILIVKYSVKTGNKIFYISSMISLLFPVMSILICTLVTFLAGAEIPLLSVIAEFLVFPCILPAIPAFSIFYQLANLVSREINGIFFPVAIAFVLPAILGLGFSIRIYIKNYKAK